jgi:hypothetical protein
VTDREERRDYLKLHYLAIRGLQWTTALSTEECASEATRLIDELRVAEYRKGFHDGLSTYKPFTLSELLADDDTEG